MAFSYSVMLDLAGCTALVAGGGKVAARKIRRLLDAHAKVTVIAPAFCETLERLAACGEITCESRPVTLADIDQLAPFVVFAATDDHAVNRAIAAYCIERGILVNSITEPERGSFAVQAEIPREHYAVSISTFGQGPGFAKALREYLEPLLDTRLDLALDVYTDVRAWLFATVDDSTARVATLRNLTLARICAMIDEGTTDYDELLERVKEWLSYS